MPDAPNWARVADHIEPEACDGASLPLPDRRPEPFSTTEVRKGSAADHGALQAVRPTSEPSVGDLPSLRDDALDLVNGARQDAYGEPVAMHDRVARVWAATFGWDVDNHKAALALALLKIVREAYCPDRDNRVDGVGYLDIADRCVGPLD